MKGYTGSICPPKGKKRADSPDDSESKEVRPEAEAASPKSESEEDTQPALKRSKISDGQYFHLTRSYSDRVFSTGTSGASSSANQASAGTATAASARQLHSTAVANATIPQNPCVVWGRSGYAI